MQVIAPDNFAPTWKWWLPPTYSSFGGPIDTLYLWIFWITMITFVVVEGVMVYFCFKYKKDATRKATYTHGSHKLEVAWTMIPAVILVLIAVFSNNLWAKIKNSNSAEYPKEFQTELKVVAQQFAWHVTYPGADGVLGTDDDFTLDNQLNVPYETDDKHPEKVRIRLTSQDVIHSFFCPVLRLKQDAVPGFIGNVWFDVNRMTRPGKNGKFFTQDLDVEPTSEKYEVACAELCGYGHYTMRMELRAIPRADFNQWMAAKSALARKK